MGHACVAPPPSAAFLFALICLFRGELIFPFKRPTFSFVSFVVNFGFLKGEAVKISLLLQTQLLPSFRPLGHPEFSTGSPRVFHWVTQASDWVTQASLSNFNPLPIPSPHEIE